MREKFVSNFFYLILDFFFSNPLSFRNLVFYSWNFNGINFKDTFVSKKNENINKPLIHKPYWAHVKDRDQVLMLEAKILWSTLLLFLSSLNLWNHLNFEELHVVEKSFQLLKSRLSVKLNKTKLLFYSTLFRSLDPDKKFDLHCKGHLNK